MSSPESATPSFRHLVIVCCHAIYLGSAPSGREEDEWLIAPFQKGETPTFVQHIRKGLKYLADPGALLVFSGGPTKKPQTHLSEAQSYLNYALTHLLPPSTPHQNIALDETATDSYQNLLFPLLTFLSRSATHSPPHLITIISHAFKQRRFVSLHSHAIRWPRSRFRFEGVDPPEWVTPRAVLDEGERRDGYGMWKGDLYGVGEVLRGKRAGRCWDGGGEWEREMLAGLEARAREGVRGLLGWGGGASGEEVYGGFLPWDLGGEARGGYPETPTEEAEAGALGSGL